MREILYRGKSINRDKGYHRTKYKNGDWVYGLVTNLYDDDFPNVPAEMKNTDGVSGIEVDYKTIEQYTGLTDKNGKKIFEGDIVLQPVRETRKHSPCIIEFRNGAFMAHYKSENRFFDRYYDINSFTKIIGNIHDNPELLKGE